MMKLLFPLLFSASLGAATLTVYTTPPKVPLDWSSPPELFKSIIGNKIRFEKRPLGLTLTKIACPDGEETIALVPKDLSIVSAILFDGRGLGLLYHTFPGELIDASDELKTNLQNPETRFVRVHINEKQCLRLNAFLKEFREKKIADKFGLPHRPLMAEGGSDTSFAVALLEVTGVMNQKEKDSWESSVFLPDELSGMPLHEKHVSVFSLMGSEWSPVDDKSVALKFWDPQKIARWVDSMPDKVTEEKATGVELDRSKLPAPQGGWWKQSIEYQKKKN